MPDIELTEEAMRQMAHSIDSGKTPMEEAPEAEPVETKTEVKAETKEPEVKAEEPKEEAPKQDDKADSSLKSDGPKEDKAKSKFEANNERKAKTWQEINAEKEAIKAEKAKIDAEKAEIARLREEAQRAKIDEAPYRDEHDLTAADYKKAAQEFTKKGDTESAEAAIKLAEQCERKQAELKQQRATEQFNAKFTQVCNDLARDNPELNDTNSELFKETQAVFNNPEYAQFMRSKPEHIKLAVQAAKLNIKAKTFDKTESDYKALKAEYEKLQKKLSISSGQPTSATSEKSDNDNSLEAMAKRLRASAVEYDRSS